MGVMGQSSSGRGRGPLAALRLADVRRALAAVATVALLSPLSACMQGGTESDSPQPGQASASLRGGGGGGAGAGICDPAALADALESASVGDTVHVGACTVRGAFIVPDGVTLAGLHPMLSAIDVPSGRVGVQLCSTDHRSTLRDIRVESGGIAGVLVGGADSAELKNVVVLAERGVGVGIDTIDRVDMTNVYLQGTVTADNADSVDHDASPRTITTHGVVGDAVGDARLRRVSAHGFSQFGALFVDSNVSWEGGNVGEGVGVGIAAWGGTADLSGVNVRRMFKGIRPEGDYAAGAAFLAGAEVTTDRLSVSDVEGWGVFQHEAGMTEHDGLRAAHNDLTGVWHQSGEYMQLDDALIVGNDYAGVYAFFSDLISIEDSRIIRTREVTRTGFGTAGDGIQTVSTNADVFDTSLLLNERIGMFSWVEGPAPCLTPEEHLNIDGLRVLAVRDQLGAVFHHEENGTALIEDGVRRLGLADRNDSSYIADPDPFTVLAEGPTPCLLPQARVVVDFGLAGLLGKGHQLPTTDG